MRVLVTGGAGYVGSHIVCALEDAEHIAIPFDDLSTGEGGFRSTIVGDIRNADALNKAFEEAKPDAVIHAAAKAIVSDSVKDPASYYDVNVQGGWQLLQTMLQHGVNRLVFSSSAAVYGNQGSLSSISEGDDCEPVNPYGETKLIFERMLEAYVDAYGFHATSLRYFNAAGVGVGLPELRARETRLIPNVLVAAASGEPVSICGTDYDTRDGTAERDYIHVGDLAEAHVSALTDAPSGAFNLGTGQGHTVQEVITEAEAVLGRPIPTREAPRRAGDPPSLVADPRLAMQAFGFRTRHDLHSMIESAHDAKRYAVA
jgi:UDP-glucose-4-epimerase GalE